jgi:hypothetical protein
VRKIQGRVRDSVQEAGQNALARGTSQPHDAVTSACNGIQGPSYHTGCRAINVLASEENNLKVGTRTFIHLLENCRSTMTKRLKYHLKHAFVTVQKERLILITFLSLLKPLKTKLV